MLFFLFLVPCVRSVALFFIRFLGGGRELCFTVSGCWLDQSYIRCSCANDFSTDRQPPSVFFYLFPFQRQKVRANPLKSPLAGTRVLMVLGEYVEAYPGYDFSIDIRSLEGETLSGYVIASGFCMTRGR